MISAKPTCQPGTSLPTAQMGASNIDCHMTITTTSTIRDTGLWTTMGILYSHAQSTRTPDVCPRIDQREFSALKPQ
jgi:hypothetical protein